MNITATTAMTAIVKTLLLAPSEQKWRAYLHDFHEFFANRRPLFDQSIAFMSEFHRQFQRLPSYEAVELELVAVNDTTLLEYIRGLAQDPMVSTYVEDTAFEAHLRVARSAVFYFDITTAGSRFETNTNAQPRYLAALKASLNALMTDLYEAEQRALGDEAAISELLYGEPAQEAFRAHYEAIKAQQSDGYNLPFASLQDVRIKGGDLVFVGAFTSEGKSAMLRALAHHFVAMHGLNTMFLTLEMSFEATRDRFNLLHANDNIRFPHAPTIPYADFRVGALTAEQEDFLLNMAVKDFTSNSEYGNLLIEQPRQFRFTMADLAQRVAVVEQTVMPVHVLVIDYVTYMHPVPGDRVFPPQVSDYNQLVKELKRLCITHRNSKGEKAPIICLTAAQVSRRAYAEAVKQGGIYGIDAFSTYTEIERSADIAMTTFMPPPLRAARQLRLQIHKNRDGVVPTDPVFLHIDLPNGMGITELNERDPLETLHGLRTLNI